MHQPYTLSEMIDAYAHIRGEMGTPPTRAQYDACLRVDEPLAEIVAKCLTPPGRYRYGERWAAVQRLMQTYAPTDAA